MRPPGLSPGFIPPPAVAVFTCRFPVSFSPIPTTATLILGVQLPDCPSVQRLPHNQTKRDLGSPHASQSWKAGADYIGISGFAATGGLFELRKLKDHAAQDDFRDSVRHHGALHDGEERLLGPEPTRDPLCFSFLQRQGRAQ